MSTGGPCVCGRVLCFSPDVVGEWRFGSRGTMKRGRYLEKRLGDEVLSALARSTLPRSPECRAVAVWLAISLDMVASFLLFSFFFPGHLRRKCMKLRVSNEMGGRSVSGGESGCSGRCGRVMLCPAVSRCVYFLFSFFLFFFLYPSVTRRLEA